MNEHVVATCQRVSNPDWLVPNGAENRLQIDFETSCEINFEIDLEINADSYPELPYCHEPASQPTLTCTK